jgi:hypothetical protein
MAETVGPRWSQRNLIFSAIFVGFSIVAAGNALLTMRLGTPGAMGPGFFPLMLSIMLGLLALGVAFLPHDPEAPPLTRAPLRAIVTIIACPAIFGYAIEPFGLVPALFLVIFISCLASRVTTPRQALLLSAAFTLLCILVFHVLLNMPVPLWGRLFIG